MINIAEIERALHPLIGLPIWGTARAGTMQMFQLGEKIIQPHPRLKGKAREVGTFALHVSCSWRIVGPNGIVVTSRDRYFPSGDIDEDNLPENFDWEKTSNRGDEKLNALFLLSADNPLIVEDVEVDNAGGFRLTLSTFYSLDVFPDNSLLSDEHWRLFSPGKQGRHWVLTGSGLGD